MADESDPPRKVYGFKPASFERVNAPRPGDEAVTPSDRSPDTGPAAAAEPNASRIDVRDLNRVAAGDAPLLGVNAPVNRANEVHAMLRENLAVADAAGLNELAPMRGKRSRRWRDFWMLVIGTNTLIAVVYSVQIFIGFQTMCLAAQMPAEFGNLVRFALGNPAAFILPCAGMVFFTLAWAWLLFGVMDDY